MSKLKKMSQNPYIVIIGFILTFLGTSFGVYSILDKQEKNLCYSVNSNRTILYSKHSESNLSLYYNENENIPEKELNKKINGNVAIVDIKIWNDGEEAIEKKDILGYSKLKIIPKNNIKILDFSKKETSRKKSINNVTNININKTLNDESLEFDFEIFEHMDGFIIQIVYEGNIDVDFDVSGDIKDQLKINKKNLNIIRSKNINQSFVSFIATTMIILLFVLLILKIYFNKKNSEKAIKSNIIPEICFIILIIIIATTINTNFVISESFYNNLR